MLAVFLGVLENSRDRAHFSWLSEQRRWWRSVVFTKEGDIYLGTYHAVTQQEYDQ